MGPLMKPIRRPITLKARVKPELHQALKKLADLSGESFSSTVNDLLEGLLPGIQESIHYLEQIKNMDAKAKESLSRAFSQRADILESAVKETIQAARDDIKQHKLPL